MAIFTSFLGGAEKVQEAIEGTPIGKRVAESIRGSFVANQEAIRKFQDIQRRLVFTGFHGREPTPQELTQQPIVDFGVGGLRETSKIIPAADTALSRLISAIKSAKPIRKEIEEIGSAELSKRVGRAGAILEKVPGEKGFIQAKAQLKGPLIPERPRFEPLRGKEVGQEDVEELAGMIQQHPYITTFEKINAFDGLNEIIGGIIPQPSKLSLLEDIFGSDLIKTTLQHREKLEKLKDLGMQLANLPRSIMSSVDLSFGGRQGIFAAPKYRKEFWSSWKRQFAMFGSEKAFQKTMKEVADNPDYLLARKSGVAFTKMGALIMEREERFASNWGDVIPVLRQSGRAYTGFANKFRMDIFSSMIRDAKAVGLDPNKNKTLAKGIADFVNTATGRGNLGSLSRTAPILNAFFFSPRLMASRIKLLNPVTYIGADPFVRKEALKSLLAYGSYVATVLTLAKLAGAEVGTDPRSADFAKVRVGNTRFDIMGGFQQYIRMAAQLVTGKYVSSVTGKEITLGEGYKPLTRFDILQRQIESKEAPIFSFITDLLRQQNYAGQPVELRKEIADRFTPMVLGNLRDLAKDDPDLLPWGLLGIFGVGVQTYRPRFKPNIYGL